MAIEAGQQLLHYRVIEKIGKGGMGEVYRARDTKLNRDVAIKRLSTDRGADSVLGARFEREAKTLATLNHPNIATLYGFETYEGMSFLVMELVDGETLDHHIPDEGLAPAEFLELALPLADALADAHRQGVVHRDLKPGNVMISSTGRLKVLDFGLAKLVHGGSIEPEDVTRTATQQLTQQGAVMGTFPYMSPEQLSGKGIDARSDVFSLGVVLYQMATGRLPFRGSGAELTSAIMRDTPPPVSTINGRLPQAFGALIARCLAKDPQERPATAAEVHDELRALRRDLRAHGSASGISLLRRPAWIVALVLGAVALATVLWMSLDRGSPKVVPGPIKPARLAVLPFESAGRAEDEQFADGLTAELTSRLAGLKNLAVISRSSAVLYKASTKNLHEIGEELGADYVLAGAVRRAADGDAGAPSVRIIPQLIRVSDEGEVWSRPFERSIDKPAAVQADIATQVVDELGIALSSDELRRLQAAPTDNALAYDTYLQALNVLPAGHGSESDYRKAETLFKQAVVLDPGFALAWTQLAEAHLGLYWFGYDVTESRLQLAFDAIQEALELDPQLPEARFALGSYYYRRRDFDQALKEFAAVYDVRPNDSAVLSHIGYIWRRQGLFDQSRTNFERALQLNPQDAYLRVELSHTLAVIGDYERGIRLNQEALQLDPDGEWSNLLLALIYWLRDAEGDLERARSSLEHYPDPRSAYPLGARIGQEMYEGNFEAAQRLIANLSVPALSTQSAFLPRSLLAGLASLASGDEATARRELEEAVQVLEQEIEERPTDHRLPSALGLAYAGLGRRDEAVRAGQRGMDLLPYSTDALLGTKRIYDMARIHSLLGQTEEALEYVKLLVSRPNDSGGAMLRLNPELANVREDPRFWEIPPGYHPPRRHAGGSARARTGS